LNATALATRVAENTDTVITPAPFQAEAALVNAEHASAALEQRFTALREEHTKARVSVPPRGGEARRQPYAVF